jgi:hypothetical protein
MKIKSNLMLSHPYSHEHKLIQNPSKFKCHLKKKKLNNHPSHYLNRKKKHHTDQCNSLT